MAGNEKHNEQVKDGLLRNVGTAIKQLQVKCCQQDHNVHFTGNMWEVQELCLHLDDTLTHGLKRLAGGYWPFVCELTHKSTVGLIRELPRAVSNTIRGWAWLYISLNDSALESHLRTIIANPKITERHYLPHALLRDVQRLQVLVMMTAGLEHLSFSLEPDTACLSGWKSVVNETLNDESLDEVEEAESASLATCTDSQDSEFIRNELDEIDSEIGIITIVEVDPVTGLPKTEEIVHSSTCGYRRRKREYPSPTVSSSDTVDSRDHEQVSLDTNSLTAETKSDELLSSKQLATSSEREQFLNEILHMDIPRQSPSPPVDPLIATVNDNDTADDVSVYDGNSSPPDRPKDDVAGSPRSDTAPVKMRHADGKDPLDKKSAVKRVSFDPDNLINIMDGKTPDWTTDFPWNDDPFSKDAVPSMSERGAPEGQEDPMTSSTASLTNGPTSDDEPLKANGRPKQDLLAKPNGFLGQVWQLFPKPVSVDRSLVESSAKAVEAEIKSEVHQAHCKTRICMKGEVPLDNNFHLMLMLEVVADQDEKVYKVFQATTGHTSGVPVDTFIVLTDRRFYVTHWDLNNNHYHIDASIPYSHIEFLQLSLNYQIINVVCFSPRRRYWLCTGEEEITRNIVSSLEVAIRRSSHVVSLPSVYTDSTTQSIAISKWVANETGCTVQDTSVIYYVLVKWEDPHAATNPSTPIGPNKNGFLMYRYVGRSVFGIKHWRPGYFRLKAGVCYQFSDSEDRTFRSYVQLLGGGCVGCRRVPTADRPHTFELILADDRTLQLAAPNEIEASEWLQAFLQAVSQGHSECETSPCISACCVLTERKIFVCHEELETNFIRSLGKADIQDVSMVHLDPTGAPYCILEFESVEATESSGDWVLYFVSEAELSKFLQALDSRWRLLYKIPLPSNPIQDPALQKRFQTGTVAITCAS